MVRCEGCETGGLHGCPCCGYVTVLEEFDICEICRWEHDSVQESQPDSPTGANRVSLREAQMNFVKFGACEEAVRKRTVEPTSEHKRDPFWRPLQ